jgi:hypothetical protein
MRTEATGFPCNRTARPGPISQGNAVSQYEAWLDDFHAILRALCFVLIQHRRRQMASAMSENRGGPKTRESVVSTRTSAWTLASKLLRLNELARTSGWYLGSRSETLLDRIDSYIKPFPALSFQGELLTPPSGELARFVRRLATCTSDLTAIERQVRRSRARSIAGVGTATTLDDQAGRRMRHRPTRTVRSIDFAHIASELRKEKKHTRARLVEFMAGRDEATVEEVAEYVHGDETTSEGAIRANVRRTSDQMAEMGVPLSFKVAGGRVFREVSSK